MTDKAFHHALTLPDCHHSQETPLSNLILRIPSDHLPRRVRKDTRREPPTPYSAHKPCYSTAQHSTEEKGGYTSPFLRRRESSPTMAGKTKGSDFFDSETRCVFGEACRTNNRHSTIQSSTIQRDKTLSAKGITRGRSVLRYTFPWIVERAYTPSARMALLLLGILLCDSTSLGVCERG